MALAAATELNSSHPIAAAFLEFADSLGVEPPPATDFSILEGEGVTAMVDGVIVHVGSDRLAKRILAETAERYANAPPQLLAALAAHAAAAKEVESAESEALPKRMVASLKKREAAAREALKAAEVMAASSSNNCNGCGLNGCTHKRCCGPGCTHDKCCGKRGCCARGGCGENGCTHKVERAGGCCDDDNCKQKAQGKRCCGPGCTQDGRCCGRRGCCAMGGCGADGCTLRPPLITALPPPTLSTSRDLKLDDKKVAAWAASGASVLWVMLDGRLAAACQLSDQIRGESVTAVKALSGLGVHVTMLTGDSEVTAQAVRAQAGIEEAHAGMKPNDKLDAVKALRYKNVVGMLGDGVNDGPALAAADVGIAMGVGGTAMASQAAGVVLMTNDLRRLADAVVSARHTVRVLRMSVAFALLIKVLPLVLMFTAAAADGYLIAAAVGSDVVGIGVVLVAAMSLLGQQLVAAPRFAASPCKNNESSMLESSVKVEKL